MEKPLKRKDLFRGEQEILSKGRWGNADLIRCRWNGETWVIKDFSPCPPIVRNTWGRWMVGREYEALTLLKGLDGIPAEPFQLDAFALGYRYIPGTTLRNAPAGTVPARFFFDLEQLVLGMHRRGMAHLDVRNRGNILIAETGKPVLLDFQSSIDLPRVPKRLHRLLTEIDLSGVYKNWLRFYPEQLDPERLARYKAMSRWRGLWVFRGYPLGMKGKRRK